MRNVSVVGREHDWSIFSMCFNGVFDCFEQLSEGTPGSELHLLNSLFRFMEIPSLWTILSQGDSVNPSGRCVRVIRVNVRNREPAIKAFIRFSIRVIPFA